MPAHIRHTLAIALALILYPNTGHAGEHWAFQPVERPAVPRVKNSEWCKNPVDRFILARLETAGIEPALRAAPLTRLRRATLDLTGLPPTVDEMAQFLADSSEPAYHQVVERLLASPHYGERWARHWLDVARYADSAGHEFDSKRAVWKYRDWVIAAMQDDMPFDDFLFKQLAGDLIPEATTSDRIATGFHCNALKEYGDHAAATIDRTNAFGTAFLGLTLGCAQCHDHKTDPLSQTEYYQLYAFFDQSTEATISLADAELSAERDALMQQVAHLERERQTYQQGPDPDPAIWAARLTQAEVRTLPSDVRQAIFKLAADRTDHERHLIAQQHQAATAEFQAVLDRRIRAWGDGLA